MEPVLEPQMRQWAHLSPHWLHLAWAAGLQAQFNTSRIKDDSEGKSIGTLQAGHVECKAGYQSFWGFSDSDSVERHGSCQAENSVEEEIGASGLTGAKGTGNTVKFGSDLKKYFLTDSPPQFRKKDKTLDKIVTSLSLRESSTEQNNPEAAFCPGGLCSKYSFIH